MIKKIFGLGVILILVGIVLISMSKSEVIAGEKSRIEEKTVGDIWNMTSIDQCVISSFFKEGDNVSIYITAGSFWQQESTLDMDDPHPYPHRDIFVAIIDSQGRNTTLNIPFRLGTLGVAMEPTGIFPVKELVNGDYFIFEEAGKWNNKTYKVEIVRNDNYTIKFLGYYPPINPDPIHPPDPKGYYPPQRFRVTVDTKISETEKEDIYNQPLLFSGAWLCVLGVIISLIGAKIKPKKKIYRTKE
ncbi:MAG: hypothetical protein QXU21_07030 [Candidatus Bathyarchaeia archaeon]